MGKLLDLLQAAAGESSLRSRLGHWRQEVSQLVDQIASGEVGDVPVSREINAGTGLAGGGDLSQDITIALDSSAQAVVSAFPAVQASVNALAGTSQSQTTWYVDPVAGNNANDGLTPATAIQTDAERQRRVGLLWIITADTTVTYLNNVPATDPCIFRIELRTNGVLRIHGTATVIYSGAFTAVTNLNRATQTASAVTDAGLGAGRTGQRMRLTSGASVGAITWLDRDFGAGVYRTSPWAITNFAVNPLPFTPTLVNATVGNTFVVESLTQIGYLSIEDFSAQYGGAASINGTQILVRDVYLTQSDIAISAMPLGTVTNAPVLHGSRTHSPWTANALSSYVDAGIILASAPPSPSLFACLVRGRPSVQSGTTAFVDFDTLFSQSGNDGIRVRYGGVLRVGTMAVFDCALDGLLIEDGNVRAGALFAGADLIWGTGNGGVGVRVRAGGKVLYVTKPTVAAVSDANVGGTARTYAQIPYMNGYDGVTVGTGNGATFVVFA